MNIEDFEFSLTKLSQVRYLLKRYRCILIDEIFCNELK